MSEETPEPAFEDVLARLETIAEKLESGEPKLEDALRLYEEGVRRYRSGTQRLDDAEARASEYYEYEMQPAVERFQARNGVDVTGRVNQATRTALNRPPGDNIPLLEANLERWRWLPVNLGATHIMVNAPAYRLRVEENGREALAMNVVVGNLGWKTPMFSATLIASNREKC